MKLFSLLFSTVMFAQAGGQPVNIPIPVTAFYDGYGSSHTQDLGKTPAQLQEYKPGYVHEGLYTLTFSEIEDPVNANYPGYFKFKLSFGTQDLCEPTGWGTASISQVTFVCTSPGYTVIDQSLDCDQNPCIAGPPGSAQGNDDLVLMDIVNGWIIDFKDVSLTFTPSN